MGKIYSFIMVLFLSIMLIPSIFAIPGFPHEFYGDVLINNSPAPDGTLISAQITGKTVITNSQNPVETVNGNFGIDDLPLLVQGEDLEGSVIKFYVNGVDSGQTKIFAYGGGPTEVNLSVTITQTTPGGGGSSGGGSSGGGSSGGGSSGGTTTPTPEIQQPQVTTQTHSSVITSVNATELEEILRESNLTDTEIQEYLNNLENNFFEIERTLDIKKTTSTTGQEEFLSTFTITIKNTSNNNLKNIKIVEEVPKEVAEDVSEIYSISNFRTLVADPVIEFTIPSLNIGQSINLTYSVNKEVKEEDFLKMKGIITKADVASFSDDKEDDVVIIPPANVEDNYNEPISLSKSNNVWLWIILILLIIGIVYFLVFGKKKSKKLGR